MTLDVAWVAPVITVCVLGLYTAFVVALWRYFTRDTRP